MSQHCVCVRMCVYNHICEIEFVYGVCMLLIDWVELHRLVVPSSSKVSYI